ncbi:MAG: Ig-like domain-containing protein [Myxococcales bacterium]|nr:MAG: Ig-like domain-containing protein [Myxococcales bacterium]
MRTHLQFSLFILTAIALIGLSQGCDSASEFELPCGLDCESSDNDDLDGDRGEGERDGDTDNDPAESYEVYPPDDPCPGWPDCPGVAECDIADDCIRLYGEGCWDCDQEDFLCYARSCKSNADCCTRTFCSGGVCIPTGDECGFIAAVSIDEDYDVIRKGQMLRLTATAFNANGAVIPTYILDCQFRWSTDNANRVAVDAETGVITGGDESGPAVITATLGGRSGSRVIVNITGLPEGDSRVVVFDDKTGALLDNARVFLNGAEAATAGGIADFPGVDCTAGDGCTLHVFDDGHTYVSAFGLRVNDILIPISPNVDLTTTAGVKGHQDPSPIPEVLQGDVRLGLSGFSIPGNLADLNFESILGEMIKTHVKLGTTFDDDVLLPGGLEGYLLDSPLKDGYRAAGLPGDATLWGLGGYADLNRLIEVVTGALGDEIDVGAILGAVLPFFENFYHGLKPGFDLPPIEKVVDVNDLNGNGRTDDLIPNYAAMEDIGEALKLTQQQNQAVDLQFGQTPTLGAGCADSVLTLMGVQQAGIGFIPLGVNATLDKRDKDDIADCRVGANNDGKVLAKFAPQHSGVTGYPYYALSIALSLETILGNTSRAETSLDLSGVIAQSDASPTELTMPQFLGFMTDATYDSGLQKLTASAVSGATFHRAVFGTKDEAAGEQRYWHIYWPAGVTGFQLTGLPQDIQPRDKDLSGASLAQAMKLRNIRYEDLFGFNGTNINSMNDLLEAFSMHALAVSSAGRR